jgi:hypothetical protein
MKTKANIVTFFKYGAIEEDELDYLLFNNELLTQRLDNAYSNPEVIGSIITLKEASIDNEKVFNFRFLVAAVFTDHKGDVHMVNTFGDVVNFSKNLRDEKTALERRSIELAKTEE